MSDLELLRLRQAMAGDPRPTPFVGAGLSAAVTDGAKCATWKGLIESGIDACEERDLGSGPNWASSLRTLLEGADATSYVTVAGEVSERLRRVHESREFSSWLDSTVGQLTLTDKGRKLIAAVSKIARIIVTTNYDTLIEQVNKGWASYTWTDNEFKHADRTPNTVLHLHGVIGKPESIILGSADYERLNRNELNPLLSKALFAKHTFIFIGCGDGLSDPDIAPLIAFINRAMPEGSAEHFILVKKDQVRQFEQEKISPKITPVGYGDQYEELLPFLQKLVPEQEAPASTAEPSATEQRSAAVSGTGMLAHAKVAERKLQDARSALDRVGDAMEDVQRNLPAPAMEDWTFEKQEAEHEQRAGALSGSAQQFEICSKGALGEFRAVEDEVSQLIEPRFAGYVSRLGRIAKETTDLESDASRLLIRAAEARDEVGGRIGEYDGYRAIYETLSRAHAAIEQARGTATRLQAALTGLVSGSEPKWEDQARQTARPAEPEAPSQQQRDIARSETWRVPIVGSAAAGPPNMSAEGESKYLSIPAPQTALMENVIAVRVAGESMTGDDLLDGDYAIVDKGRAFRAGAIAVVRIGESEYADMAVKHVWREKDGLRLRGSNPDEPPTKVPKTESPEIEGMVIGVFRPASYRSLSD